MRRLLVFIYCLTSGLGTSQAAIDLTPTLTEYKANGLTFQQLVFKDGSRQVTYELPPQWTYRVVGSSVKLLPPNSSSADIFIQAQPLTAPQPLDEKGIAAARQHFLQAVPPTAQTVKLTGDEVDTVPFKTTNCEFTATYQALGEVFIRRALYINLPDTQLIFRLTAQKAEFENLWRTFRGSVLSWQWIEPASSAAPVTASK
jgi:hypothetical protein